MSKIAARRATIRDVADAAGVSVGSVSNVLNGNLHVREATETKIRKAIATLEYRPSVLARGMRTRATHAIGFIVNDISNPLYSGIVKASEKILKQQGYYMLLMNSENRIANELELLASLNSGRVDAVVSTVSDERDRELLRALERLDTPLVLLDRNMDIAADTVQIDYSPGVSKAVNYLSDLGHSRIALICAGDEIHPGREFVRGFVNAMRDKNLPLREGLVYSGSLSMDYGYQSVLRACADSRPSAIIAGGNRIFSGVLRALNQLRLKAPDDVSVIACDDTELTSFAMPGYTVLTRDTQKIGGAIAELLLRRLRSGESAAKTITIDTELLVRASCAAVRRDAVDTADAADAADAADREPR